MKGLSNGRKFSEQIRLAVDIQDLSSIMECTLRIAELQKKGYRLVDTYIDEQEQNYFLENAKAEA
ncbi:hypothetical protein DFR58_11521 [Anaerobacterium chartisolvens]|uniref:Uncharacterized protein n=1 Tax=Anaerobacterium chartisolvens TaxID=1297424 RepID=A0A369B153_9FIRM|nr:hypothetical protein [Anaerobacterium chartisolvens]RCX14298.1 hypothetical protein DFR58_11521 [Anaerobacterium chartisolvens]